MKELKYISLFSIAVVIIQAISSLCGLIYWIINWNTGSVVFFLVGTVGGTLTAKILIDEYKEEYK